MLQIGKWSVSLLSLWRCWFPYLCINAILSFEFSVLFCAGFAKTMQKCVAIMTVTFTLCFTLKGYQIIQRGIRKVLNLDPFSVAIEYYMNWGFGKHCRLEQIQPTTSWVRISVLHFSMNSFLTKCPCKREACFEIVGANTKDSFFSRWAAKSSCLSAVATLH